MSQPIKVQSDCRPTPTIEDYLAVMYVMERDREEVIPARLAASCAAAACSAASHCSQAWNSTRSDRVRRSAATSADRGSASAAGQVRQSGPCTSAIAHHVAQSSTA